MPNARFALSPSGYKEEANFLMGSGIVEWLQMPKGLSECFLGAGWIYYLKSPLSLWLCDVPCPTVLLWAPISARERNGKVWGAVSRTK